MYKKKKKINSKHKVAVKKTKTVNKREAVNDGKNTRENNKYGNGNEHGGNNGRKGSKNKDKDKENSCLAVWTAPEFIKTRGEILLYYVSVLMSVFMIARSFMEKNYVVTVTFVLLIAVVIFYIFREPRDIECKIDFDGITVAGKFCGYEQMESFEVFHGDGFNTLKFKLRNDFLPVKEVQLATQDPHYIRALLEHFLPEEKQKESLVAFERKRDSDDNLSEEELKELNEYEKAENKRQKEI